MPVVYDIRQQIPQFKDNYFPPYNYQPYPRMMVNKETGKPYKTKTNEFVIVGSEQEEKNFLIPLLKNLLLKSLLSLLRLKLKFSLLTLNLRLKNPKKF
jgi:hypothetical protein